MANNVASIDPITVSGSEKEIRAMVRKAVDQSVVITPYEMGIVEDAFLRLALRRMRKKLAGVEVGHGQ